MLENRISSMRRTDATMRAMRQRVFAAAALAAAWGSVAGAAAQAYPSRPITMVVPLPAGGPTDGVARMLANDMSDRLGQRIVIENKASLD